MIAKCFCTPDAQEALATHFRGYASPAGVPDNFVEAEIEFRELPYLFVLRSREKWQEGDADPHSVRVVNANDSGVLIDPGQTAEDQNHKAVFIPWTNIISFTVIQSQSQDGV
ncbi:MAG: hypothetical protein ACFCU1_12725 [Sumerlaeia bacterium]